MWPMSLWVRAERGDVRIYRTNIARSILTSLLDSAHTYGASSKKTAGRFTIFIAVWGAEDMCVSEKKVVAVGRRGGGANTHTAPRSPAQSICNIKYKNNR